MAYNLKLHGRGKFKPDTDISGYFEVKNDRFRVIGQVTIRPGGHREAGIDSVAI